MLCNCQYCGQEYERQSQMAFKPTCPNCQERIITAQMPFINEKTRLHNEVAELYNQIRLLDGRQKLAVEDEIERIKEIL